MGRMLGSFADDQELDRPDLNKCPDCDCFFASDACPLCGKICPENMRAGNRPAVKKRKPSRSGSGRVTFIQWYHSWWFIAIMVFVFPIAGIALLVTSPHKKWQKILFVAIAMVYLIISMFGIGNIISRVSDIWDTPVNDSLTREEYVTRCEAVSVEQFCRAADGYEDRFISMKLKIVQRVTYMDTYYNEKDYTCYLCEAEDGSEYRLVLRDCLLEDKQKLLAGDVVTVYGEGAGDCITYDAEYNEWQLPCLNMAYVTR
ncbi:MAG: cytochrome c biogenesis protein ResB [Ruminococcaceae bacterium]|nr:cytochrome c biogenesis protein ResB [Oscillospiraceae bacterium]